MKKPAKIRDEDGLIRCAVCGEAAMDGIHDQFALWHYGVHHAEVGSCMVHTEPPLTPRVLHVHCVPLFITGLLLELKAAS